MGVCVFFFQAEDGIRDHCVTGVQTCALPICLPAAGGGLQHGADQISRKRSAGLCPRKSGRPPGARGRGLDPRALWISVRDPEPAMKDDRNSNGRERWEARVRKVLKGRPFDELKSFTVDGIEIEPLYPPSERPG